MGGGGHEPRAPENEERENGKIIIAALGHLRYSTFVLGGHISVLGPLAPEGLATPMVTKDAACEFEDN